MLKSAYDSLFQVYNTLVNDFNQQLKKVAKCFLKCYKKNLGVGFRFQSLGFRF